MTGGIENNVLVTKTSKQSKQYSRDPKKIFGEFLRRERGIPFIISAPVKTKSTGKSDKLEAFARLEAARKLFSESIEYDVEREEAMNGKYGSVD